MLGREEVANRDDLAQRERTEPALNEAMKPAKVQQQLGGRLRDQLVGAVRRLYTAELVDVAEKGVMINTFLPPQTARIRFRLATAAAMEISCATIISPTT